MLTCPPTIAPSLVAKLCLKKLIENSLVNVQFFKFTYMDHIPLQPCRYSWLQQNK